jgi:branched-chain amino acid transport system ATP-binding protein
VFMLEVKGITVSYDDFHILWDASLNVDEGQIVAIVGPNGAGKTTLMHSISGLIHPSSGSVEFLGKRIDGLSPPEILELGLIQVPEGRHLFPDMTVRENLELGAYARRARGQREETLKMVLDIFPILKDRRSQLVRTLSGGEQQMLAIARALMSKPIFLILDEPSLGLAPRVVLQLFEVLRTVNREGVTVLLVEQNVRQALALAHKGYVLETGRIVLEDEGRRLLENERVKKAYLGM